MKFHHLIFILGSLFLLVSSKSETGRIEKELLGVWILDSVSSPRALIDGITLSSQGNFVKYDDHQEITFKKNNHYSNDWMNDDVGNTFVGKFFVLDNPGRGFKTITFIPDIHINNYDTVRIKYENFDIVSLSKYRLQVVKETEFIRRKALPVIRFNKHLIYKKIESN